MDEVRWPQDRHAGTGTDESPRTGEAPPDWEREREQLLALLAQQQRVAQAGLITSGLVHDVNNHIQGISGAAFLAVQSEKPGDWKAGLESIQEQCCALTGTTRAFLEFVKRRDMIGHRIFRLSDVVEQASRLVGPLAHEKQIQISTAVREESQVRGDVQLAVQAVVNLLSNSVRACDSRKGHIEIEASRPRPGVARIRVSDNGPGIPEEIHRHLFKPFTTGHADSGGNGIGIFIVRQAVRKMDGTIRVQTSAEGTTFVLEFPVASAD